MISSLYKTSIELFECNIRTLTQQEAACCVTFYYGAYWPYYHCRNQRRRKFSPANEKSSVQYKKSSGFLEPLSSKAEEARESIDLTMGEKVNEEPNEVYYENTTFIGGCLYSGWVD